MRKVVQHHENAYDFCGLGLHRPLAGRPVIRHERLALLIGEGLNEPAALHRRRDAIEEALALRGSRAVQGFLERLSEELRARLVEDARTLESDH